MRGGTRARRLSRLSRPSVAPSPAGRPLHHQLQRGALPRVPGALAGHAAAGQWRVRLRGGWVPAGAHRRAAGAARPAERAGRLARNTWLARYAPQLQQGVCNSRVLGAAGAYMRRGAPGAIRAGRRAAPRTSPGGSAAHFTQPPLNCLRAACRGPPALHAGRVQGGAHAGHGAGHRGGGQRHGIPAAGVQGGRAGRPAGGPGRTRWAPLFHWAAEPRRMLSMACSGLRPWAWRACWDGRAPFHALGWASLPRRCLVGCCKACRHSACSPSLSPPTCRFLEAPGWLRRPPAHL